MRLKATFGKCYKKKHDILLEKLNRTMSRAKRSEILEAIYPYLVKFCRIQVAKVIREQEDIDDISYTVASDFTMAMLKAKKKIAYKHYLRRIPLYMRSHSAKLYRGESNALYLLGRVVPINRPFIDISLFEVPANIPSPYIELLKKEQVRDWIREVAWYVKLYMPTDNKVVINMSVILLLLTVAKELYFNYLNGAIWDALSAIKIILDQKRAGYLI